MKILIPTMLHIDQLAPQIAEIRAASPGVEIVASCRHASASVNRNACLDCIEVGEVAITVDDDISGFYPGWIDDLVVPFSDPQVVMVSARLLNPDGTFGPTCSRCYDPSPAEIEVKSNGCAILPTAALAFRYVGIKFDESYVGSGFEDSDFCQQYLQRDPGYRFIQSNRCRLIHRNEMKNQKGLYWQRNRDYFFDKWRKALA